MPTAYCLIRPLPHYRREAFERGLVRAGYSLRFTNPVKGRPGDVLVIWNRYGDAEVAANAFEPQGGRVLVAENGYCGRDANGLQLYAIAEHGHNGSGLWPSGEGRFAKLGIEPKPWRASGGHLLICGQRGIGSRLMASPQNWHHDAARRLRAVTNRPLRVRGHPGSAPPPEGTLEANMAGAHAVVVWSSGAGVQAIIEGFPVYFDAPHWILADAAGKLGEPIEAPRMDDAARAAALERMAWAQWTIAEIESGEPFVRLLGE